MRSLLLCALLLATASSVPAQCGGGANAISSVAAGRAHALALRPAGVWAWGDNAFGQVGSGIATPTSVTTPVQVLGFPAVPNSVVAGNDHNLALVNGTVWAWGRNDLGQLGNGTTVSNPVPVQVPGLTGVASIAAGGDHCLAVVFNGATATFDVWAWGDNSCGQLGQGTLGGISPIPVRVAAVSGGNLAVQVAAGSDHCLALVAGVVRSWGRNDLGQLGLGSVCTPPVGTFCCGVPTPTLVNGPVTPAFVYAGGNHSIVIEGAPPAPLRVWGDNRFGQLGLGTSGNVVPTPTQMVPPPVLLPTSPSSTLGSFLDLGLRHTVMNQGGWVWGWGDHAQGQLGIGTAAPIQPSPVLSPRVWSPGRVAAGADFSLVLRDRGEVTGFGSNALGQLGAGTTLVTTDVPVRVPGISDPVRGFVATPGATFPLRLWSDLPCAGTVTRALLSGVPFGADAYVFGSLGPPAATPLTVSCGQPVYLNVASMRQLVALGAFPLGPAGPWSPWPLAGTSVPMDLPASLAGVRLTIQAVAIDSTFPCGFALSNGLELIIE